MLWYAAPEQSASLCACRRAILFSPSLLYKEQDLSLHFPVDSKSQTCCISFALSPHPRYRNIFSTNTCPSFAINTEIVWRNFIWERSPSARDCSKTQLQPGRNKVKKCHHSTLLNYAPRADDGFIGAVGTRSAKSDYWWCTQA